MKKIYKVLSVLFLTTILLMGCSSTKLAEDFDKDVVAAEAQKAVNHIVNGEYDEVNDMVMDIHKEALSADLLKTNMDIMNEQTGAFKEIKSTAVVGQKDADGEDIAIAVLVADFEKRKVTYTIGFNKNMELILLYMK